MTHRLSSLLFGLLLSLTSAQETNTTPPLPTLDQKATGYYKLLQKKPENAPVLQRFIDAWLENGDQKQLLTILRNKAKTGTANEWRILAAASEYLGDNASALTALNESIKTIPDDAATLIPEPPAANIAPATPAPKLEIIPALPANATAEPTYIITQGNPTESDLAALDGLHELYQQHHAAFIAKSTALQQENARRAAELAANPPDPTPNLLIRYWTPEKTMAEKLQEQQAAQPQQGGAQ